MSVKRKWMKLVLGMNIFLENPIDALQGKLGFKVLCFIVEVCSVSKKEFST
jgi:hypothetical protein